MTSWHPLVVYLYGEGLARFATEPYSIDRIERRFASPAAISARATPLPPLAGTAAPTAAPAAGACT